MTSQQNNESSQKKQPQPSSTTSNNKKTVQYIFLRCDLDWPAGAMAAQAAHASVAAIVQAQQQDPRYEPAWQYTCPENLSHMTKVVYGVADLNQLNAVELAWQEFFGLAAKQQQPQQQPDENGNNHGQKVSIHPNNNCAYYYKWQEQPENIPTALATWPIIRTNQVSKFIKKLNLEYY